MNAIVPIPKADVTVRPATPDDLGFIDALQKINSHALGFMRESWIEAKIAKEKVLIAQDVDQTSVGYVMGTDRYQKHDDVGVVYQLNVASSHRRGLVGATLLKALFDASAYGCKLYSCWCAQDLAANQFWEAMGFVPLAYRAGSEKKRRVHIFWQKRIRQGDVSTPWWFPCATTAGAMSADRIVLPIPLDKHWSDEMPVLILPQDTTPRLEDGSAPAKRERNKPKPTRKSGPLNASCGLRGVMSATEPEPAKVAEHKPAPEKRKKRKNDPKLAAVAREFRDRYLEHISANDALLAPVSKYNVARTLPHEGPKARWMRALAC